MERGMREKTSRTRMMSAEKGTRWGRRSAASHLKLVKTYAHITLYMYIYACVCENGPEYE